MACLRPAHRLVPRRALLRAPHAAPWVPAPASAVRKGSVGKLGFGPHAWRAQFLLLLLLPLLQTRLAPTPRLDASRGAGSFRGVRNSRAAPWCCRREPGQGLPAGTETPRSRGKHHPAPCPGPRLTNTRGCASPPGWVPALPRQPAPGRLGQASLNLIAGNKLAPSLFPRNQWDVSGSPRASPCPRAGQS